MSLSDYLETEDLNATYRGVAKPARTNVYIALFTVSPSDAGGGTEVTVGNYARPAVAVGAGAWTAPADDGTGKMQITNAADILFNTPNADWGTVVAFGAFDAASGGNLLDYGALDASQVIQSGNEVKFATGSLKIKRD